MAVDHSGEVFPISRWTGQKTKAVKAKLGEIEDLQFVDKASDKAAARVAERLQELKAEEQRLAEENQARIKSDRAQAARQQRQERAALSSAQKARRSAEEIEREKRLRKGLLGLLDRLTGRRRKTLDQNTREAEQTQERDRLERQRALAEQAKLREGFKAKSRDREARRAVIFAELDGDIQTLRNPAAREERKEAYRSKRQRRSERSKRARDGPAPEP